MQTTYLVSLGSNQRHSRYGSARSVIVAALARLGCDQNSSIRSTAPIGPSRRRFTNAATLIKTELSPPALLDWLNHVEREFGRKRIGKPWGPRTLDLDIILWSGGCWADQRLVIPHCRWHQRRFVVDCLNDIAPRWRDPITNLSVQQVKARLDRKRPAS